jgi:hypothetical protein
VWGKIEFDHGQNGGILPYVGPYQVQITDANDNVKKLTSLKNTDQNGLFKEREINVPMAKNDKVRVLIPIDNGVVKSNAINPSYPFNDVVIEEADYFNDYVKGYVKPVFVKDWDNDGKMKELLYNGNVNVSITTLKPAITITDHTTTDEYGNFVFKKFNVHPTDKISAKIEYMGFAAANKFDVKPSIDITAKRIPVVTEQTSSTEQGKEVDFRSVKETFIVYNLRGTKAVTGNGSYEAEYRQDVFGTYLFDYITGIPLKQPKYLEKKVVSVNLNAVDTNIFGPGGTSKVTNVFNTKWIWADEHIPITTMPPVMIIPTPTSAAAIIVPWINNPIFTVDQPQNTVAFNYDSKEKFSETQQYIADGTISISGLPSVKRVGKIKFPFEGTTILIEDKADAPPRGKAHKPPVSKPDYSLDAYLARYFWSRINPDPRLSLDVSDRISNLKSIPSFAVKSVKGVLDKRLMDLTPRGTFKTGYITKGECAAYLAKTFGLKSVIKERQFKDIPTMHPYLAEINAALDSGFVSPKTTTAFGTFDKVNRGQMATMIMKGLKLKLKSDLKIKGTNANFKDYKNLSTASRKNINGVVELGIMKGSKGLFNPSKSMSFADIAVALSSLSAFIAKK